MPGMPLDIYNKIVSAGSCQQATIDKKFEVTVEVPPKFESMCADI